MRRRARRAATAHLVTVLATAALALAGCGSGGSGDRGASPGAWKAAPTVGVSGPPAGSPSSPPRSVPPAATAGPACAPLTYDAVATALGARLDVAASSGAAGHELVCVLTRSDDPLALDLTYVTNPTPADKESFQLDFAPNGATPVTSLGKAAYRRASPGGEAGRTAVEVGWLGSSAVHTLTCTLPGTPPAAQLEKVTAGLIALAKKLPG